MSEYTPLTKEERANIVQTISMLDEGVFSKLEYFSDLLRYEATVAALEAENARLRPLAAVGEAVEGMPVGAVLLRHEQKRWVPFTNGEFFDRGGGWIDMHAYDPWHDREYEEYGHPSAHEALAALRAAKGKGDA